MCPLCLATAAIIAGSATGTGGLAALVAGRFRKRKPTEDFPEHINTKEDSYGYEPDGSASPENCHALRVD